MFNGALSSVGAQGYSSLVAPISIIANLQNNTSHTKDSVRIFKGLNYIGLGNIFICFLNICIKKKSRDIAAWRPLSWCSGAPRALFSLPGQTAPLNILP